MHGVVVVIAGALPSRSETFVTREIRGLRERGWQIRPVSLHATAESDLAEFQDLAPGRIVVYGRRGRFLGSVVAQAGRHPLRTLRTLAIAMADALRPGEPTNLWARLRLLGQAAAAISLGHSLRANAITHVHCHFAHAPTTVGMYLATHLGVPFSFVGHANDLFQRRALLRRKLQRAAFVSCISEWHRQLYQTICPDRAERFAIVRCGVPTASFRPAGGGDSRTPVIVSVARLVAKKGLDTLVRAVALLRRDSDIRPTVRIVGDGPERSRLVELAAREACPVEWLGARDNDAVRSELQRATVFVLPCRIDPHGDRDGIPVALMEAMACGVACVSGDLPAIRELITHEDSGILIDGDDPIRLASALIRLLRDTKLRQHLAARGRERIREEFALDTNLDRLERCLARTMRGATDSERHDGNARPPAPTSA